MKSEKAEEYLNKHRLSYPYEGYITDNDAYRAVEIAEEEVEELVRTELTRWNNPKEELPARWQEVILKIEDGDGDTYYRIGVLCENDHFQFAGAWTGSEVIGWREIHE